MIVTQDKTTTLYAYQNGIGANTEAILNRTLRHILYGDEYVEEGGDFSAPYDLTVEFKMTNRLELNWKLDGFVDEQRYYRSETPFTDATKPVAKAVLLNTDRTYIDTDIDIDKTYYVAVGSVKNGVEKLGLVKTVIARDMNNIVSLMLFDTDFTDLTGKIWTKHGDVQIVDSAAVFSINGALESQNSSDFAYGVGDFEWKIQLELGSTGGNQYIIDHGTGNAGALSYYLNQISYYNPETGIHSNLYNTEISLNIGTKYTIEVKRVSGITSIYIDGILRASGSDSYNYTATKCWVGRYPAGTSQYLDGKIDYFRIKKIP